MVTLELVFALGLDLLSYFRLFFWVVVARSGADCL